MAVSDCSLAISHRSARQLEEERSRQQLQIEMLQQQITHPQEVQQLQSLHQQPDFHCQSIIRQQFVAKEQLG